MVLRVFGDFKTRENNKPVFNPETQINVKNIDKGTLKMLNKYVNILGFLNFDRASVVNVEKNYAKCKLDEIIRMTRPKKEQVKQYVTEKLMYMLTEYNRLMVIQQEVDELTDAQVEASGIIDPVSMGARHPYESAFKYTKDKYTYATFRIGEKRFLKIYEQVKDSIYSPEKLRDALRGNKFNTRITKLAQEKEYFEQKTFNEAVKLSGKNYPLMSLKISSYKVDSLAKSRDQYLEFINNPSIVKNIKFVDFDTTLDLFETYYRKTCRTAINFYNFIGDDMYLMPGMDATAEYSYYAIYGVKKGTKKMIEHVAKGLLHERLTTNRYGFKLVREFNGFTPKNIVDYPVNTAITGEGIGVGWFMKLFAEYTLSVIPKKLYEVRFIEINSFNGSLSNIVNEEISYQSPTTKQELESMAPPDKVRFNTGLAVTGKRIYAYFMKTYIADTWIMDAKVALHGFSSYNNKCAMVQTIPLSLDYFYNGNTSLTDFFSRNDLIDNVRLDKEKEVVQLGYFLKKLPADSAIFNFNTEDNYFCPVTALIRQGGEAFKQVDDKQIRSIYHQSGIYKRNDIRIYKGEIRQFYMEIAKFMSINFIVNIYNVSDSGKKSANTVYFVGNTDKPFYIVSNTTKKGKSNSKLAEAKKLDYLKVDGGNFAVCLFRGHVFNCNVHGAVAYLIKIAKIYDELEDSPDIHIMMNNDLISFRNEEEKLIEENKGYLLRNLKSVKKSKVVTDCEVCGLGVTCECGIGKKYVHEDNCLYYGYDYETYFKNVKYSYVPTRAGDLSKDALETGTVSDLSDVIPYSNMAMLINPNRTTNFVEDSLYSHDPTPQSNLKMMINWMINNHITVLDKSLGACKGDFKSKINCFVFAHNGANFDNIITMYDILKFIDLCKLNSNVKRVFTPRKIEVAGKPLSFELQFMLKSCRKVNISFRDSYRILSVPLRDLGSTYGIDVVKLDYPYAYFQNRYKGEFVDRPVFGNTRAEIPEVSEMPDYITKNKLWDNFHDIIDGASMTKCTNTDKLQYYKSYLLRDKKNNTDKCISWARYGYYDDLVTKMATTDKFIKTNKYNNLIEAGFTEEFIVQCAWISRGMFNKITTNPKMVKDLQCYRESLEDLAMFIPNLYCKIYNYYDVYNMIAGMIQFQKKIKEMALINKEVTLFIDGQNRKIQVDFSAVADLNIFQFRSISSIAWEVAVLTKSLVGVEKLNGHIQKFISCDKRGGKTFVNHKRSSFKSSKYEEICKFIDVEVTKENVHEVLGLLTSPNASLVDNDAVSMYLCAATNIGIPMGVPIAIGIRHEIGWLLDNHKPFWVAASWQTKYEMDLPQSCQKTDGKNCWRNGAFTNQVISDIEVRYMLETGEMQLSDFKFKDGEIIGCWFNECNYTFAGMMHTMITERIKVKKSNSGLSAVLKLIGNSVFGSSILKEKESCNMFVPNDKVSTKIAKNRCKMTGRRVNYGNYSELSEYTKPSDHAIYPQCGVRILSMSKVLLGRISFGTSNIHEKIQYMKDHPEFKLPEMKDMTAWSGLKQLAEWTVKVAEVVNGKPLIKWSGSYNDTDSVTHLTDALPLIYPFLGEGINQFHSDYDFPGELAPLCTELDPKLDGIHHGVDYKLARAMKLSAIEAYYCSPKSYSCKVFGIKIVDGVKRYGVMEHTRLKGVYKGSPCFEDLKKLYYGNPLKYISKSDCRFIHSRGNGLGQVTDYHVKEIMPMQINDEYYYAEGDTILSGHYRFDEMPITRQNYLGYTTNNKVKYSCYSSGGLEFRGYDWLSVAKNIADLDFTKGRLCYGEYIKCGFYLNGEEPVIVNRLDEKLMACQLNDYKTITSYKDF